MNTNLVTDPTRRHDFVLLFDVADGNPNGDPDAGNLPRVDPVNGHGLVTDVAIKRKVRDYVDLDRGNKEQYKIFVQHRGILANEQRRAFQALNKPPTKSADEDARRWMCENFYDIRMFGAVMTTGKSPEKDKHWNCGQVRGPLQLTFSRSISPIERLDLAITRVALTNADDTGRASSEDDELASSGQMGRKSIIPYGLYRAHGFFNPHFAKQTGVTAEDLDLFWQALQMMWDTDRSASRGMMACRGLYIFTHTSSLGDAPAHKLLERVAITPNPDVTAPRSFHDYTIDVHEEALPEQVTLTRLVEG